MNKPNINVTPLIDVLLVLLIIFMVISPAQMSSFKTKIPAAPDGAPNRLPPNDRYLVVTVNEDLSLKLNRDEGYGTVDDPAKLTERLAAVFSLRREAGVLRPESNEVEKTVFIKAPKNVNYGAVARVVDAVKLSGAEPVGLQIDGL